MAAERRRGSEADAAEVDVAIVGAGNWGTSLAAGLTAAGIPLREVVARGRERRKLGGKAVVPWKDAVLDADILWICVPDAAIVEVAERIARKRGDLRGQMVVHSSGALTVGVLDSVRRAGAAVASVHPAMSFPTREAVALRGVLFGVEAKAAATRRKLYSLVRRLGGQPFSVEAEKKALYHAAGTLASPLLVSELAAAMETARLAGLDAETAAQWVRALAGATAANVFAKGAGKSFSGPFARGDAGTIDLHLQALGAHPILADVYRSLARYAVAKLPAKNVRVLKEILKGHASHEPSRDLNAKKQGRGGRRVRD